MPRIEGSRWGQPLSLSTVMLGTSAASCCWGPTGGKSLFSKRAWPLSYHPVLPLPIVFQVPDAAARTAVKRMGKGLGKQMKPSQEK